jgi:hypothetical protein
MRNYIRKTLLADRCAEVIAATAAVGVFGGYERLRTLAWDLEKAGADLCVASALLAKGSGAC